MRNNKYFLKLFVETGCCNAEVRAIFDRGIQKKQTFVDFSKNKIFFISRITNHCFEIIKELETKNQQTETLNIISDRLIKFKIGDEEITNEEFRLVVGENKKTKEIIS